MPVILAAGRTASLNLLNLCVWAKTNGGMGSLYRPRHELLFVFKSGHDPHTYNIQLGRFGRNRSNVWNYSGANSFARNSPSVSRRATLSRRRQPGSNKSWVAPTVELEVLARDVASLNAAKEGAGRAKLLRPPQPLGRNGASDSGFGFFESASFLGHNPLSHESLAIGVESLRQKIVYCHIVLCHIPGN